MFRHPLVVSMGKAITLSLAFALTACQQQSASPSSATAKAEQVTAPVGPDVVGIPECDDYLNKYEACVMSKAPGTGRVALKQSLNQTRTAWRSALAAPGGREGLATACKQARTASKASLSAYGCTDF
jgi:hypothetical protein